MDIVKKTPLKATREQRLRNPIVTKQPSLQQTASFQLPSYNRAANNSVELTKEQLNDIRGAPYGPYKGNTTRYVIGRLFYRNQNEDLINVNRSYNHHPISSMNKGT